VTVVLPVEITNLIFSERVSARIQLVLQRL